MQNIIPHEIIKKVRHIEIKTKKVVDSILSGGYHSAFKGRGMEFSEVRAYTPGDDIRSIDWNVTAKSGFPYIKVFHEERELTVILVVDASASLKFGTRVGTKQEIAAEIGALLSFSAIKNNDNVGLLMFSSECEKFIPPRKGKTHVLRVIREILYFTAGNIGTSISAAMERLTKIVNKKSLVFIISDFMDADWKKSLAIVSRKHDVIPIVIRDSMEQELPRLGLVEFYDEEHDRLVLVDTTDEGFRAAFARERQEDAGKLEKLFRSLRIEPVFVSPTVQYVDALMKYFKYREKRR